MECRYSSSIFLSKLVESETDGGRSSATLRQVHRANIAMSPHQGVLSGIVRLNKIIFFDLVLIIAQLLSSRIVRGVQILVYIYRHSQHLQTTKIANAKPNQPYQVLTAL